jgi:hypothetical protein
MANVTVGNRVPSIIEGRRLPGLPRLFARFRSSLRRRSRQDAQAEALVNRFASDRWSDGIEREISIRVR